MERNQTKSHHPYFGALWPECMGVECVWGSRGIWLSPDSCGSSNWLSMGTNCCDSDIELNCGVQKAWGKSPLLWLKSLFEDHQPSQPRMRQSSLVLFSPFPLISQRADCWKDHGTSLPQESTQCIVSTALSNSANPGNKMLRWKIKLWFSAWLCSVFYQQAILHIGFSWHWVGLFSPATMVNFPSGPHSLLPEA